MLLLAGCGEEPGKPSVGGNGFVDLGGTGGEKDAPVPLPEIGAPDTGAAPPPGFDQLCSSNDDCPSEWCVEGPNGNVCTETCIADCPPGWDCKAISNVGSDVTFVCVALHARLCWPCDDDTQCQNAYTDPVARCVKSGAGGGFCGTDCSGASANCPAEYECQDVPLADGGTAKQCVPQAGASCQCTEYMVQLQLETTCQNVSPDGSAVCTGKRQCLAEGLTACDAKFPALEVCDGKDNDCDGTVDGPTSSDCVTWFPDTDGDDYGIGVGDCLCDDPGLGFGSAGGDCNDLNANVNPGNPEICNFADDDCDGATDELGALGCTSWYPDVDEDGWGGDLAEECTCGSPDPAFIATGGDCDDSDKTIKPGATETCDGADNDCDGEVDEEDALGCVVYYVDGDGDGFGQDLNFKCLCEPDEAYTTADAGDCNDLSTAVHPLAVEICNGADDNCDGTADEDGTVGCAVLFKDVDEDGFGDAEDSKCFCAPAFPYLATNGDDCNDDAPTAFPGGAEVCDGLDNDCNEVVDDAPPDADCINYYVDADEDGWGAGEPSCQCKPLAPYLVTTPGDCNDVDPTAYPGGQETCAPADENCNGQMNEAGALGCVTFYKDADGDGWGVDQSACVCGDVAPYTASVVGDCYDDSVDVFPGQVGWYTKDRGDGSFDYDCDGNSQRQHLKTGGKCGGWPSCSTKHGWTSTLPDCGVWGSWVYDCDTKIASCDKESDPLQQSCR